jgi:outer membrane protein TolC
MMYVRAAALTWLLAGVLPLPALAEEPGPPLRLAELVAQVKQRNPSAAAAVRRVEAARIAIARARALPDPFAQAMVEDVPLRITGGMPMLRVQASQMFPWFGKRDRMAAVAAREADASEARADAVVLDLMASAKRLYQQLVLNRTARRLNREQRAIVDTVVQVATSRLRTGTGSHHDVLKMQTEASMLDDGRIMLEADRQEMAAMLNALLDRGAADTVAEPEETWTDASPLDRGRLTERALDRRPELREMRSMEAAERAMAAAARREYYPDVMLGALYDVRRDQEDAVGAMIGINVPLWIGGKQRLDARAAETRAAAVDRDRAAMAAMVRAEIERQVTRIEAAGRRLALLDGQFLPRAQQTFDSALAAFPAGTVDALELLDALRAVINQRLNRVAVQVERELAHVDLERALGAPLKETAR